MRLDNYSHDQYILTKEEPMTKTIPLTKGYEAIVDDEDYERVSQYKWCASVRKHTVYAQVSSKGVFFLMHRLIMDAPKQLQVDHRDGNGLNNTKANLRLASQGQNLGNLHSRTGASQYKGVSW